MYLKTLGQLKVMHNLFCSPIDFLQVYLVHIVVWLHLIDFHIRSELQLDFSSWLACVFLYGHVHN